MLPSLSLPRCCIWPPRTAASRRGHPDAALSSRFVIRVRPADAANAALPGSTCTLCTMRHDHRIRPRLLCTPAHHSHNGYTMLDIEDGDAFPHILPGHNWCTAAPCTMAWFIGIAMHLHLGASQLPGTVLHRAPRCIRPLRHPHRGACQPYCTECAPAPRCIPALLNVSLTLGQHCNSTKKTSEVKY